MDIIEKYPRYRNVYLTNYFMNQGFKRETKAFQVS